MSKNKKFYDDMVHAIMDFNSLLIIEPDSAKTILSNKRGIYFWFTKETNFLVYIGVALGAGGLKRRIVSQHLNPRYLEFRVKKHTSKDKFQLANAVCRMSKDGENILHGIDKSSFRKSVGRKLELNPGIDTVNHIINNMYFRVFESEDISQIKEYEVELIKKHQPEFNTSHKPKLITLSGQN